MRKRIQWQLFWFLRYKYNNNDNNNNKSMLSVLKIVWASSLYKSSIKKIYFQILTSAQPYMAQYNHESILLFQQQIMLP